MPSYAINPKTYEPDRQRVADVISQLSSDKAWQVEIKPLVKHRSLNQNALYWKWMGIIATETGNAPYDLHEYLKAKFLTPRWVTFHAQGEGFPVGPSTKSLNTKEMAEYMEQVSMWAASFLGLSLPHPSDVQMR